MELLPGSTTHSRAMSYEEAAVLPSPRLRSSNSMQLLQSDGRANPRSTSEESKAVMSGVLLKNGQAKYCRLLGAYFAYGDAVKTSSSTASLSAPAESSVGGKSKQLSLSDATANFEPETLTIRLTKLKVRENRFPLPGHEKIFVAKTESEYYLWQAAITRAMALWPGANAPNDSSNRRPPVNADTSSLGCMLRQVLRTWTFATLAMSMDIITAKDVSAGLQTMHVSNAKPLRWPHQATLHSSNGGQNGEHGDVETLTLGERKLTGGRHLTKEAFNSVLVNTLVQLSYLLPSTLETFLMILMEQRGRQTESPGVAQLLEEVTPKLRRVGDTFASIALEYGFDVVTGLWPADLGMGAATAVAGSDATDATPLAQTNAFDDVDLFRAWMDRAPTAPWSAVLVLAQREVLPRLRNVLQVPFPPRSEQLLAGLNGIRNAGNTCYLNSVLQCVLHNPHLVRFFLTKMQRVYVGPDSGQDYLSTMLSELTTRMYTSSSSLDATPIADFLVGYDDRAFKKGDQHDAHEALVTILDVLDSELAEGGCRGQQPGTPDATTTSNNSGSRAKKRKVQRSRVSGALAPPAEVLPDYTSDTLDEDGLVAHWRAAYVRAHNSLVTHYFSGQTVQKITCPHCKSSSFCCDSFTYLIAPIIAAEEGKRSSKDFVRLEKCVEQSFKPEMMDMGDKAQCAKCQRALKEAQRTLELQRLPPYLLLCLNRFEVDDHGKASAKRDVPVLVPEQLSLGTWLRSAAALPILGEGGNVHLSQMDRVARRRGGYELYAAVLHSGSIHHGHYLAVCRVGTSWYEFSDSSVTRLGDFATWSEASAKDIYVLFYRSTAGDV